MATATEHHVIVLAPLGRDAIVITRTLGEAGIACLAARDLAEVVGLLRQGVGAVVTTVEGLTRTGVDDLLTVLAAQPSWSDLPLLLLLASGSTPTTSLGSLTASVNLTALQRPLPALTLVSAVQAALRARRRQYEVRDLLARERAAREQAEHATQVKDEFLAAVSHELRTPLNAILLWANLLEAGPLSADQTAKAVQAIARGAEAQSQLIEDLLDISRMMSGRLRIDPAPRPLSPILQEAISIVRPMAIAKSVAIDLQIEARPDIAFVDAGRFQQIVWNLLTNAVKFTPAQGVVTVRLEREQDRFTLTVADTGVGIHADFLPHLFERFRQADPQGGQRQRGLGLGLSIVKQLVELHGGTIRADSPGLGHGTTFTVQLPITGHH